MLRAIDVYHISSLPLLTLASHALSAQQTRISSQWCRQDRRRLYRLLTRVKLPLLAKSGLGPQTLTQYHYAAQHQPPLSTHAIYPQVPAVQSLHAAGPTYPLSAPAADVPVPIPVPVPVPVPV